MVQRFLLALRNRGGLVSSAIAVSTAKALVTRNPQLNLSHTGKVEIPAGAKKEAELLFLHNIVSAVEKYQIPRSLIMNLDQTPLKYVPAMNHTMAK